MLQNRQNIPLLQEMRLRSSRNLSRSKNRIAVSPDINTYVSVSNIHNLFIIQKLLVKSIALEPDCLNPSLSSAFYKPCKQGELLNTHYLGFHTFCLAII